MTNYSAHIEPLASIIRVFNAGDKYGDKYLWSCAIRWISPTKVELCSVIDFPVFAYRHAIGITLWKMGVTEVFFIRKKDGKDRVVIIDVENMAKREGWNKN